MSNRISFRLITEQDFPLLHMWQNQEHMYPYYQQQPITIEEIKEHYAPKITGEQKTNCHMALLNGEPFGYLQCYRNSEDPEYATRKGMVDGIGVDLYIGDASLLGKGLGRNMLKKYLDDMVFALYPEEENCYIWHNSQNSKAISCSKSIGFQLVREVEDNGALGVLFLYKNPLPEKIPAFHLRLKAAARQAAGMTGGA